MQIGWGNLSKGWRDRFQAVLPFLGVSDDGRQEMVEVGSIVASV